MKSIKWDELDLLFGQVVGAAPGAGLPGRVRRAYARTLGVAGRNQEKTSRETFFDGEVVEEIGKVAE